MTRICFLELLPRRYLERIQIVHVIILTGTQETNLLMSQTSTAISPEMKSVLQILPPKPYTGLPPNTHMTGSS